MKKTGIWLLVITLFVSLMTGCSITNTPDTTRPTRETADTQPTQGTGETQPTQATAGTQVTQPTQATTGTQATQPTQSTTETQPTQATAQTQPTQPPAPENPIGKGDTYWVASQWYGEDGPGAEDAQLLPTELWNVDLLVRADGTARFRDVHEGICLADESLLHLTWERTPEGELLFYSALNYAPAFRGTWADGILTLDYLGSTLVMKQEAMPQTVGQMYSPAEMVGTWVLVSTEAEGEHWSAMPDVMTSLVIAVTSFDGPLVLAADMEEREYRGNLMYSEYAKPLRVLGEPLYEGCENGEWSVLIGDAAPLDANGYPTQTETRATLLDANKLLLRRRYTLDGYPAMSSQTYLRITEQVSWMDYQSMELGYTNWVCTGCEDASGEPVALPAGLEGLSVILSPDGSCIVASAGTGQQSGTWLLENGGVLILRGDENLEEPFWFGGVISGYWVEEKDGSRQVYEMALYHNGTIIKLGVDSIG